MQLLPSPRQAVVCVVLALVSGLANANRSATVPPATSEDAAAFGYFRPPLTEPARGQPLPPDTAQTGDLATMKHRGTLRVLMLREQQSEPGSRDITFERELIGDFAQGEGLTPVWLTVDNPRDLLQSLQTGSGDVVIGDIPLDIDPEGAIDRTVALKKIRYLAVTRAGDRRIQGMADLAGLRVGLNASSPVWPLLRERNAGHPAVVLVGTDGLGGSEILDRLADGRYDFTVIQSNRPEEVLLGRADLRVAFDLTGDEPVSWLVRRENAALREALNRHLKQHRMAWRAHEIHRDDLDGVDKRGVLRVITRPDPDNYFLSKGERAGFEYDLIREFATRRGLRMEVVVADSDAQMLAWLKAGVGDVVTARVHADLAENDPELAFSRTFNYVAPVLVARRDLRDPRNLDGRRILVQRDSLCGRELRERQRRNGARYQLIEVSAEVTAGGMVGQVAAGAADYTVVDAPRLAEVLKYGDGVRPVMSIDDRHPYRFTVRSADRKLLASLDGYLKNEYGSELYNAAYHRYFEGSEIYALAGGRYGDISPYDDLVQRYADRYGFDWRLIVALMYQESHFDPDVTSPAGARGLMQILPETARGMGFNDLFKPEVSIHAGIRYLDVQREQFEDTLAVDDRTWFAIAAYNAGFDRVQAARRLAGRMGLDSNRWFANVEKAMLALNGRNLEATASGGLRWSGTTVAYVREIRSRYEAYLQLLQPAEVASL